MNPPSLNFGPNSAAAHCSPCPSPVLLHGRSRVYMESVDLPIEVTVSDLLKENSCLYAHKARRKKIALIVVEFSARKDSDTVTVDFGSATFTSGGKDRGVEPPERLLRRFREFTWDFLFFLLLDFNPLLSLIDFMVLLGGPLYNRRLKKQLCLLTDGEMVVRPGTGQKAILGFLAVRTGPAELRFSYRSGEGDMQMFTADIGVETR